MSLVEGAPPALIPRIATARLVLREPRLTDFAAFAADAADPVASAAGQRPVLDARQAWRWLHAAAGHWLLQGMGWWVLEEKDLGAVGMVGVFRRELGPNIEMGWSIYRPHWNKGYASEAARPALDFARTALGADRVIAHVAPSNFPSARVATKIGMHLQGEVPFYGEQALLFAVEGIR
jgi:RimJ/RimL family protein N-acetyltransferase